MTLYISTDGEIRDLPDDLIAAWEAAGNPKAAAWTLLPPRPSDAHQWIGGAWVLPAQPVPAAVSPRQLRIWLVTHGVSLDDVSAAIAAIPDATQRQIAQIEWDYSPYYERNHEMLQAVAAALGMTSEQVDQAFREAATI